MQVEKLLIATGNAGKLKEIREIFTKEGVEIPLLSLADFPDYVPPEETGDSFGANAFLKAMSACERSGLPCLADDSGLTVEALGGAPGVFSARYAGEPCDDGANRAKLLREMAAVPKEQRGCAFVCSAVLVYPQADGSYGMILRQGECRGVVAKEEKGDQGFGYDSLFFLPEMGRTMAELSSEEKNALSHRGRAMAEMARVLREPLPESSSCAACGIGCC